MDSFHYIDWLTLMWLFLFVVSFSLCHRLLQLQLPHLWQLYVPVHWPQLQTYHCSHIHGVRRNFWSVLCGSATTTAQGTQWGGVVSLTTAPLLMSIMPWAFRWVFIFRVEPPTDCCNCHQWLPNHWDLHHHMPSDYIHVRHMCLWCLSGVHARDSLSSWCLRYFK